MKCTPIVVVQIAYMILPGSARGQEAPAKPVEDCVEVRLSSVTSNRGGLPGNVSVYPPSAAAGVASTMSLTFDVEIRDPNRILGTTLFATITRLTDAQGRDVALGPGGGLLAQIYRAPRYRTRLVRPTPLPKWRQVLQSVLRLGRKADSVPEQVFELMPSRLSTQVEEAPLRAAGAEIQRLEGYFHALTAGSLEYVDVPFKPSSSWATLTPGQEIRVVQAQSNASSYSYETEARSQSGPSRTRMRADSPLPSRMVVAQQLLGDDGKPIRPSSGSGFLGAIGGGGSGTGTGRSEVKTIRYVIAVDPEHSKIPFVFEHIPLPKP